MKRHFVWILALLVVCSFLFFAGKEETAKQEVAIGNIQLTSTHPYHIAENRGAAEAARRAGVGYIMRAGENKIETQVAAAEDMIKMDNVKVISINPVSLDAFYPVIDKIVAAGKKAVVMYSFIEVDKASAQVRFNEIENSGAVAEYAVQLLIDKYGEPRGKTAIIGGILGTDVSDQRAQGFIDVMDKYPDIEMVQFVPADWDPEKTAKVMEDFIVKYPDLDVVYCLCDEQGVAAYNVVERAGLADKIYVVALGATQLDAIKSGALKCSFLLGLGPEHTGFTHQSVAAKVAKGESVPYWTYVGGYLVTQENVGGVINLAADIKKDITKIDFEHPDKVAKEYGIIE
jgi:ribose transport system substrate-binding protein